MDKDDFEDLKMSRILTNQLGVEVGVITLNRPSALNALNYNIINGIQTQLRRWLADDSIEMVVIKGNGTKAYCAGGDIKALYDANSVQFLADEYRLDEALYRYPKPVLHLMHGFVMGGGMGLMASGALKFCAMNTEFSMPEAGIGFFPDVGYRYHLARYPKGLGAFLGLSSARFTALLAEKLGVVDRVLPYTDRNIMSSHVYDKIASWSRKDGDLVRYLLNWAKTLDSGQSDKESADPGSLERLFAQASAGAAVTSTDAGADTGADAGASSQASANEEWLAAEIPSDIINWSEFFFSIPSMPWVNELKDLTDTYASSHPHLFSLSPQESLSPLSIIVTSILLRRAEHQELTDVFNEDFWAASKLYKEGDLREGILAKVIERRPPTWSKTLDQLMDGDRVKSSVISDYEPPEVMAAVLRKKLEWE